MKKTTPRRSFLEKSLKAGAALALLTSAPSVIAAKGNHSKPAKINLRTVPFGKHVAVNGKIFDKDGVTPLKNAQLDVWHLSYGSKSEFHQGKVMTNDQGQYHVVTDMPRRDFGKHHKVHFKISHDGISYTTELSFNRYGAYISGKHWEENRLLEEALLFPTHETFLNKTTIHFNITINN